MHMQQDVCVWSSQQLSFTGPPLWPKLQVGWHGGVHPPKSLTMVCDFLNPTHLMITWATSILLAASS
jgi:hypothetical protein